MNYTAIKNFWKCNNEKMFFGLLFILAIFKYCYYGYTYYPIVDDNCMYGTYYLEKASPFQIILNYGIYATRPVVAFFDVYIWSKLWAMPGVIFLEQTVLHFSCVVLLYRLFKHFGLNIGAAAIMFFMFIPMGSEATYWLSASSRIITGLFFSLLAFNILITYEKVKSGLYGVRYSEEKRLAKRNEVFVVILFFIIHLISLGFYEQVIALNFAIYLIVFVLSIRKIKPKVILFIPILNYVLIAGWYMYFKNSGDLQARGQLVNGSIIIHIENLFHIVIRVLKCGIHDTLISISQGLNIISNDGSYWYIILAVILVALFMLASLNMKYKADIKLSIIKIFIGCVFFAAPFMPYAVLESLWITYRSVFLSFIGIGLIIEGVLDIITFGKYPLIVIKNLILGIFIGVFLFGNVYELDYYKKISTIDKEIVSQIAVMDRIEEYSVGKYFIVLVNTQDNYIPNEHNLRLANCTAASWALNGALRAYTHIETPSTTYTMKNGEYTGMINSEVFDKSIVYGLDEDRNVFSLKYKKVDASKAMLITLDSKPFGILKFDDKNFSTMFEKGD